MSATIFESFSKCNQTDTLRNLLILILKDHNLLRHWIKKNSVVVVKHVENVVRVVIGINVKIVKISWSIIMPIAIVNICIIMILFVILIVIIAMMNIILYRAWYACVEITIGYSVVNCLLNVWTVSIRINILTLKIVFLK